ncbi:MAG TPA: hypothetical protein VF746_04995 [Longimicrobium sp.]|jgi:hypothetical protein
MPVKYDPQEISGGEDGFPYAELPTRISEKSLKAYHRSVRARFGGLAATWGSARNAEWMVRAYFAAKLAVGAGAMLSVAGSGRRGTGRLAAPYLVDDGVFDAARALLLLLPEQPWGGGALLGLPRARIAALAADAVAPLDRVQSGWVWKVLEQARRHQEHLWAQQSAGAAVPGAGAPAPQLRIAVMAARFLAELAQWHSEVLAGVLGEALEEPAGYDLGVLIPIGTPGAVDPPLVDDDDPRRLGGLMGELPHPISLAALLGGGLVEELRRPWEEKAGEVELDWSLVLPLP